MEKRIIVLLFLAVLVAGCSDNFLSSDGEPITPEPQRVIFNRYEWQPATGSAPTGIASIALDGRASADILPGPVLLVGAPQSGKMLYFQVHPYPFVGMSLVVSDVSGRNSIEVREFGDIISPHLRATALSPDGQIVAYVRSELQIKSGRYVYVESVMLFDIVSRQYQELDNFASFLEGASNVKQFISQLEFSPDGAYLAIAQWGKNTVVSVYDVNSHAQTVRTTPDTGPFFTWASDSRTLFYTKNKGMYNYSFEAIDQVNNLHYNLMIPSASDIRTLDILDGTSNLIESANSAVMELDVSPMDSALVYTNYRVGEKLDPFGCDLMVKNLRDGSTTRNLTDGTGPASRIYPQWSSDGSSILFTEYFIYKGLEDPVIFPSSVNTISTKTGRSSVVVNNAYGGYWMP